MSLYPPRTVVGIRVTRRRDILEERWRHWQNIVDSRKVANAIRATKVSIEGLTSAFEVDPPSTFAPYRKTRSALSDHESPFEKVFRDATSADSTPAHRGRAGAAPRVFDAYGNYVTVVPSEADARKAAFATMAARATGPSVALAWKHWRHFVHIRRHALHLVSALVEHECAVVAWKAWKVLALGRPVARDPEVVVAWKHWKFWALAEVAARHARADALAKRLRAARNAELKRMDDEKVRELRRANAAAERRSRADKEWGFSEADEYAVRKKERARQEARRQKEAQLRRRNLFGPDGDPIEEEEEEVDEDAKPMTALDFATFSHTIVCWRRWRRFIKGVRSGEFINDDAADEARAEAEAQARLEEVRLAAMRRVGVDAPEIRNLHDLAMRRQPGDSDDDSQRADSEDEDEDESDKGPTEEEERAALEAIRTAKREAAALMIQKIAKGFIQRRRYQKMKKDPFYRVRGLKALIARGEKVFERDAESVARAKEQWFKSERRLAGMRMANEDAMSGLKVAKDRLGVLNEARGRIGVAERAEEIERKRDDWTKIWDDSQPGFSAAGYNPFPSFPRDSDTSESARKARRSAAFASLPSTKDGDAGDADENVDPGKVLDALLEETDEEFERRMMQVMPRWTPTNQSPIGLPLASRRTPN